MSGTMKTRGEEGVPKQDGRWGAGQGRSENFQLSASLDHQPRVMFDSKPRSCCSAELPEPNEHIMPLSWTSCSQAVGMFVACRTVITIQTLEPLIFFQKKS